MSAKEKQNHSEKPAKKHKGIRRTLKIISISLLSLILFLGIVVGILMYVIFTPARLTPIVNNQVNKYLDVEFATESIDLTLIRTFPDFSIRIKGGNIISKVFSEEKSYQTRDSLLSFSACYLSFNPIKYLKEKDLTIHKVTLDNCNIYAFMDTTGKGNWEVYAIDTTKPEDTTSFDLFEFFSQIDLKELEITSGYITFDDTKDKLYANLNDTKIDINGNLQEKKADLQLDFSVKNIVADQADLQAVLDNTKLVVSGKMRDDKLNVSLDFSSGNIAVKQQDLSAELKNTKLELSGRMEGDKIQGDIGFSIKNIFAQQGNLVYSRKLHLDFSGGFTIDTTENRYDLQETRLAVNGLDFLLDGYFQTTDFDTIGMDINMSLHAPAIATVKKLIPVELLPIINEYDVNGEILVKANAKGIYAPEILPQVTASVLLKDGAVSSKGLPVAFENIVLDANAFVDFQNKRSSYANLNKLSVYWPYSYLHAKGKFNQILGDPRIDASVELASNLSEIQKYASIPEGMDMNGDLAIDLQANVLLSDVMNMSLDKINVSGNIYANELLFSSETDSLFMQADSLNIVLATNKKGNLSFLKNELGEVFFSAKNVVFSQADQINLSLSGGNGEFYIGQILNNYLSGVKADMQLEKLVFQMGGSLKFNSDNIALNGSVLSNTDTINPLGSGLVKLNLVQTHFEQLPHKADIDKIAVELDLKEIKGSLVEYLQFSFADTTQSPINQQKDTIVQQQNEEDFLETIQELLKDINFNLLVDIQNVSVESDLLPLQTDIPSFKISLDKDTLALLDTRVNVGKSNISLAGYVNNLQSVLFEEGVVNGKVALSSDLIDCNEILYAFVFSGDGSSGEDANESVQNALDTIPLLVVIPQNINVEVNTNIKQLLFNKADFQNVTGDIVIRNQHALLDNLTLISDIGEIKILMLYEATSTKKALAGVDLHMNKVDISKLIENIPEVDSILPMLKSFEGIVDCQIVARTQFDSMMNINLPATVASCYVRGEDLVLLDGETFRTISKWLLFKNKKRNLIDSISVEFSMRENKIVFFPFSIQLDRYRAMVGGMQNADMSFDYHVSLIDSPLPFKLGVNLKGNPDKIKIRPAKAKYKKLAKDANNLNSLNYSNQRKQLYAAILKSIQDIIRAPDAKAPTRENIFNDIPIEEVEDNNTLTD